MAGSISNLISSVKNAPSSVKTAIGPAVQNLANNTVNTAVASAVPKNSNEFLLKFMQQKGNSNPSPSPAINSNFPDFPQVVEASKEITKAMVGQGFQQHILKRFYGKNPEETKNALKDVMQMTYVHGMQALKYAADSRAGVS